MSKTVAYLRLCDSESADKFDQIKVLINQYCSKRGLMVNKWFMDHGSALDYNRKGFIRLMQDVEEGHVKRIVISHPDRLVIFGYDWFEQFCQRHGAEIISIGGMSLTTKNERIKDLTTSIITIINDET